MKRTLLLALVFGEEKYKDLKSLEYNVAIDDEAAVAAPLQISWQVRYHFHGTKVLPLRLVPRMRTRHFAAQGKLD